MDRTNIVICPHCGAENIEGSDLCGNCSMDLRTVDVPDSTRPASDSPFLTPISALRIREAATVPVSATVADTVAKLRGQTSGAIVVLSGTKIAGIFTERDVLKKVAGIDGIAAQPISAFMTPDPVVLRDDDTMAYALNKMGDGGFRHIPVTRGGALIGLLTAREVLGWVMSTYFD